MALATIPTVYYPWSYNAAIATKLGLGAVYDDYGKKDVVDYVHDEDYKKTIESIDKKITFTGENLPEHPIKKIIDINTLKCNDGFIDTRDFSSLRSIVPLKKYQNMMKRIKEIDPYINNDYCYVNFLKWAIKNKPNIHNNNKLVCVGHSNKMKNLENILKPPPKNDDVNQISDPPPKNDDVNRISETAPLAPSLITQITFIRHGYSCNNTTEEEDLDKDWDPSLTIYGMLTAIKMGNKIAKTYSTHENMINVCVSPLLRTWQTAILLFGNNYDTINLNICPYLTEAYPTFVTRISLGRGNTPIEFRWQLKKLHHFLQLLLQNKDSLGFNTTLKNINIQFVEMDTIGTTNITIDNDVIFKYDNEEINMTGQKTTVYANSDLNSRFTGKYINSFSGGKHADPAGSEHKHHNMWRIELTVDKNMITNTKIIDGVPEPTFKTKNCEKGCAFNGTFRKTRYDKEKCDEQLGIVDDDDNKIIRDAFALDKEGTGIAVKKPSSFFSRIKHILTRKNNRIIPSSGGKKNHRKTAKKSSRKTRRKSNH